MYPAGHHHHEPDPRGADAADQGNRFLRSFLYYVPYVTLAVMTFPSIIQTTMSPISGTVALMAGIVAAWRGMGLFPVAAICCAIVYLMDTLVL